MAKAKPKSVEIHLKGIMRIDGKTYGIQSRDVKELNEWCLDQPIKELKSALKRRVMEILERPSVTE